MARRDAALRADRARGATLPYDAAVHGADDPPRRRTPSPSGCARSSRRSTTPARRFVFPVHPRTRHALDEHGLALPRERRGDRAARLPRDARARRRRRRGRHRLGRPAEGGVLAPRPVRHAAPEHRVGRHGRRPARTGSPSRRELAGRARRRRGSRPTRRSSTATATPPNASQQPCTLDRRAGADPLRRRRHRRRLRRRAARRHLRRSRAAACCSSTCSRTSSRR